MDEAKMKYEPLDPSAMPAPALLNRAVPLFPEDFHSGEIGRFLLTLSEQEGFSNLATDEVKALLAAGLGYTSWETMSRLETDAMATIADMPRRDFRLLDVVAWRMYVSGRVGLREACSAVYGAWTSNLLTIRKIYGDFAQLNQPNEEDESGGHGFIERAIKVPRDDWRLWPRVKLTASGKLQVKWAAELAHDAAAFCWTPECGLSLQDVAQEILRGGEIDIATAIEQSWMYNDVWPHGLLPTAYKDSAGKLVGYGWIWKEFGLHHSRLFGSTDSFKKSAVAMWLRAPTEHLALPSLPSQLIEVEFKSPWDTRDFERGMSESLKSAIAFETRNMEQGPWMNLHRTDGFSLRLGRDVSLDGEIWTGPDVDAKVSDVDGVLGLSLPTMDAVKEAGREIDWMLEKVPFAFSMASYETMCRLTMAVEDLRDQEIRWMSAGGSAEQEISNLLLSSIHGATPGIAAASASAMEEPLGLLKHVEVPSAGREMLAIYPELAGLGADVRGEYALAYYGKNGIRHDHKHCQRDLRFMAYAVLRNLGVAPSTDRPADHLALHRVVRMHYAATPWKDAVALKKVSEGARKIDVALKWVDQMLDELDDSLSGPSRLTMRVRQAQ
jgi:hypothetical protein